MLVTPIAPDMAIASGSDVSITFVEDNPSEPKDSADYRSAFILTTGHVQPKKLTPSEIVKEWQAETAIQSSVTARITHPLFLRLIGIGESAIPDLLERIKSDPARSSYLLIALQAITGENPVPADQMSDASACRERWLEWGRLNEHIG